jgi:hypothetical protein
MSRNGSLGSIAAGFSTRKGKVLRYSPRLSEVAIACNRRSEASLGALLRTI